jgi:hypothetical protein
LAKRLLGSTYRLAAENFFVITRPLSSVLILSYFTGASFDEESTAGMKETAVFSGLSFSVNG